MKKFLLSLACVLGLGAWANATTVKVNVADQFGSATTDLTAWTVDGVTITPDKADANNAPAFNKAGDARLYAKSTLTISASANIKSISFAISTQGLTQFSEITPSVGAIAEQGVNPLVWNGEATSVTFTVGSANTYGSNTSKSAGQFDFTDITIELDGESSGEQGGEQGGTDDPVVTPETPAINSIAEFIAKNDKTTTYIVNFDLTVGYCTSSNVFVTDGTDFIQIYKKNAGFTYQAGDVFPAGWEATYDLYYTTPELLPAGDLPEVKAGTFTAKEVELSAVTTDLVNSVVVIKNVTFAEETPSASGNFTGTNGEASLTFRNSYKIESVEAGTYDVLGVINIYSNAVQVYPISYTKSETTSVSDINVENGAVEYFNLQGVRVANPENGIYVRRQGNKVSKVVIR